MKYIELSFDREIELMTKYQIFPEELLFIKLVFLAQEDHPEYLSKYFSQMPLKGAPRDTMLSLQEKGIINKSYKIPEKGKTFNPLDIDFNKNFMKSYLQHSYDMGMELFMNYPPYMIINGKQFSLRNIAKSFKNLDDFAFAYGYPGVIGGGVRSHHTHQDKQNFHGQQAEGHLQHQGHINEAHDQQQ